MVGYYLTSDRDARRAGVLPGPVFDAGALQGRTVAATPSDGYAASLAVLARAATSAGFFNVVADADGQVRSGPLIAEFGGRCFEPLSPAVFRVHTGVPRVRPGLVPLVIAGRLAGPGAGTVSRAWRVVRIRLGG